ncbi:MAG: SLC13 family permease [Bacteroidia bacterium]
MQKSFRPGHYLAWALGPLGFAALTLGWLPFELTHAERVVMATSWWMAAWWITERAPAAITALLPILIFPLSGAVSVSDTTRHYGHPYIFLFLGGFLLATAMEKWQLHRRIAYFIIRGIGFRPDQLVLGFMVATAFLSMWISNTATAVMLLPVAIAMLRSPQLSTIEGLPKALMLGLAYSASIGGMSTLIGTPPNLVLAGLLSKRPESSITFVQWMIFAIPLCSLMLVGCWWYLTHWAFPLKSSTKGRSNPLAESTQLEQLPPMSGNERRVLLVFGSMVVAWVFRGFLFESWLPAMDDTLIALLGGIMLFILPSVESEGHLLQWEDTKNLPWGILLLFGGGMALAHGFEVSGLSRTVGDTLAGGVGIHPLLFSVIVVGGMSLFTEFTSNLAATTMILPVLLPVGEGLGENPVYILTAATLAASCAFMMPVSTPPNAVVFGSGYLKVVDMIKAGLALNIIAAVLISLATSYWLPLVLGWAP